MEVKSKIVKTIQKIGRALNEKDLAPVMQYVDKDNILAGKIALITGGSGGIGSAMAESFMKSGAKVIICGTNENKLKNICSKICGGGY